MATTKITRVLKLYTCIGDKTEVSTYLQIHLNFEVTIWEINCQIKVASAQQVVSTLK